MSDEAFEKSGRILLKSGLRNIKDMRVPSRSVKFMKDIAHTMVILWFNDNVRIFMLINLLPLKIELSWFKTMFIFVSCYFLSVSRL